MVEVRIDRQQKNIMRENLEKVLAMQKELDQQINVFYQEAEVDEYRQFFEHIKSKNDDSIQTVASYMVRKCNR